MKTSEEKFCDVLTPLAMPLLHIHAFAAALYLFFRDHDIVPLQIEIMTSEWLESKICMLFSVAVLTCLTQPPPPGIRAPTDHNNLGKVPPPPRYTSQKRGTRSVQYNDGADLAFIMAAGWMMSTPSNYYFPSLSYRSGRRLCCRLWRRCLYWRWLFRWSLCW